MPWKVEPMSELRVAFVQQVVTLGKPVAVVCREFGISRKTGHKWLARHRDGPQTPLADRSRRPRASPCLAAADATQAVLEVRDRFGWGPRKIRAFLRQTQPELALPSERTVASILQRGGRIVAAAQPRATVQFFERAEPHELWQCDFKGPLEIDRVKVHPFVVLDDHSRYLLAFQAGLDLTMKTAWSVLWAAMGEFGMPLSLLCDNAFGTGKQGLSTVSWFESQLIRLGIRPLHGHPYHPQTQGKIERLNGTLQREVWPFVRRDSLTQFNQQVNHWRTDVYNAIRPHEALGDRPPLTRFRPSPRPRPARLPDVEYPPGALLRRVASGGDISWRGRRILVGAGIVGQRVRIEDRDHEVAVFYGWKQVRCIAHDQLQGDNLL